MEKVGLAWDKLPGLFSGVGRPKLKPPEPGVDVLACPRGLAGVENEDMCSSLETGAIWMTLSEDGEVEEDVLLVGEVLTTGFVSGTEIQRDEITGLLLGHNVTL